MRDIDGVYAAYIAGQTGEGVVFLVFKDQCIVGCDLGGFHFDGSWVPNTDASSHQVCVRVKAPPNIETIQGQNTGQSGIEYNLKFELPHDFEGLPFLSVTTPLGPVNMRLERLRGLGSLAQ